MYGLKQAVFITYKQLFKYMDRYGYYPIPSTIGLCYHCMRRTTFCLCVDEFGVKYLHKDDADHLLSSLAKIFILNISGWKERSGAIHQLE